MSFEKSVLRKAFRERACREGSVSKGAFRKRARKAARSRNVELREGSGIATAKGQTEFAATASPRPAGRGRDRESSVVRSNFIEHRVQSDVKRVRMEARSNVPSAQTTPQPSLDNDEPPHGRRGRKSRLEWTEVHAPEFGHSDVARASWRAASASGSTLAWTEVRALDRSALRAPERRKANRTTSRRAGSPSVK